MTSSRASRCRSVRHRPASSQSRRRCRRTSTRRRTVTASFSTWRRLRGWGRRRCVLVVHGGQLPAEGRDSLARALDEAGDGRSLVRPRNEVVAAQRAEVPAAVVLEASAASLCVAAHLARGGGLGEAAVQLLTLAAVIVGAEAGDGLEPGRYPSTSLYTSARRVRACLEPSPVLLLTGIEAVSGTNTDSMRSEPPYDDSAKAEQPRPIATVRKTHSSFDVEQNVLPKRRPERVEVSSVSSPAPWTVRRGLVATQGTLNGQGSTRRGRRRRRRCVGADASDVFLVVERVAGADASDVFLVDVRSEQRRESVGVDPADRGEILGGLLGAVDQVGLALALDLAERGGGLPLVDALRVCERS